MNAITLRTDPMVIDGVVGRRSGNREGSHITRFIMSVPIRDGAFFPVQLTTSRIDNHTRLIHTLLKVLTITYMLTCARLILNLLNVMTNIEVSRGDGICTWYVAKKVTRHLRPAFFLLRIYVQPFGGFSCFGALFRQHYTRR